MAYAAVAPQAVVFPPLRGKRATEELLKERLLINFLLERVCCRDCAPKVIVLSLLEEKVPISISQTAFHSSHLPSNVYQSVKLFWVPARFLFLQFSPTTQCHKRTEVPQLVNRSATLVPAKTRCKCVCLDRHNISYFPKGKIKRKALGHS